MMIKYYPSFYGQFRCLASDCPDSCCAQWEIPVDDKSWEFFSSLQTPFGEKIRAGVATDADGDRIFTQTGSRCPFLNAENLCDIRINLGWEHTCEVCRQHPDFIEEYDDFTEICPSFSCPAAAQLITAAPAGAYPRHSSSSPDSYLVFALGLRNRVLDILDRGGDFSSLASACLSEVFSAENAFASDYPEDDIDFPRAEYDGIYPSKQLDYYDGILSVCSRNEILTDEWKGILEKCAAADENAVNSAFLQTDGEMTQALKYLFYRFFLKAVNGYPVSFLAELLVQLVCTLKAFSVITGKPFAEICRLCSKETEHSAENLSSFAEYFL